MNRRLLRSLLLLGPLVAARVQAAPFVYSAPCKPAPIERGGAVFVPGNFLANECGARVKRLPNNAVRVTYFGKIIDFVLGETVAHVNGSSVPLPATPIFINETVFLPLDLCAQAFGFGARVTALEPEHATIEVTTRTTKVTQMRYSITPERVRVAFELEAPCAFAWTQSNNITLTMPGPTAMTVVDALGLTDVLVRQISHSTSAEANPITRWVVHANYRVPTEVFTLSDPPRIAIELSKVFEETTTQPLAPGATLRSLRRGTPTGPLALWWAEFDLQTGAFEVAPVLVPNGSGFGLDPTSAIAGRERALVALNGGYFGLGTGPSLGTVVINGEWIRPPINGRACLCLTRDGRLFIENLRLNATVQIGQRVALPVAELNTRNQPLGLTVFTPQWVGEVPVKPTTQWAALISAGKVTAVLTASPGAVPSDGVIVVANGPLAAELGATVQEGEPAEVKFETIPPVPNLLHALGAGPWLVKGGQIHVTNEAEKFTGRLFAEATPTGRSPRSAIGLTREGKLLLVVIDGRNPHHSYGATLWEASEVLKELGAVDALNLDGGGSTTLVVNGRVVNVPSSGAERRVANALVVRLK